MGLVRLPARNRQSPTNNRPALQIVDIGTRFNAALFLNGESSTDIWSTLIRAWSSLYIEMPNSLLVDQDRALLAGEWRQACKLNNIELISTGTESHNSLNAAETSHAYLRSTFNKIHKDFPTLPDDVILAMSIKSMNDCVRTKGLCLSLFVFGVTPRLPPMSRHEQKH